MPEPVPSHAATRRTVGLIAATGVGIGAIVGGGIFVLAGVAFAATGPGAVLAFAFNGVIAVLTALSFAEMSTAFPESGGAYTFAKKVLSVRAAFGVGWTLWFAYLVAAVLYALGFASYATEAARGVWARAVGPPPEWLAGNALGLVLALAVVALYTLALARKASGGGQLATVGKVVVFVILIAAGAWAWLGAPSDSHGHLDPLLPHGVSGLVAAMGFTFIAVQGFDLISAIAGEIREPKRTIPRAMLLSLALAMVIYLPLLLLVATVGTPEGTSIDAFSQANPETVMALAAQRYMGEAGYWLVVVAAILSTLSALSANFLAASRVAQRMAQDRTLPRRLRDVDARRGTPTAAVFASAGGIVALLVALPDLAAAGAAASLIFLISFALSHLTCYLARVRGSAEREGFRTPLFPVVPVVGGLLCLALAVFQAVVVPSAGLVTLVFLALGAALYVGLFARRAEAVDAGLEAADPSLVRLRGRSPLVLVPVANPANAPALVSVANAVAPPNVGRVLLLSVVTGEEPGEGGVQHGLETAQQSLGAALAASMREDKAPEALLTIASRPWLEIARVAEDHACESLLLGFGELPGEHTASHLEETLAAVDCDVLVLRTPADWHPDRVERVLVPVGGRGGHDALRARLLASLNRSGRFRTTFLRVFADDAPDRTVREATRELRYIASEEAGESAVVVVERDADVVGCITRHAAEADLVVLGLQRIGRRRRVFGSLPIHLSHHSEAAILMISRG